MTTTEQYLAPQTLEEAVQVLAGGHATILAGGTDILPRWSRGLTEKPETLISLKHVAELTGIARANGEVRVGACTPLSAVASDPLIREAAPVLAEAGGRIACPQVRNRATIGGNLCNASPAADTAIPLILLDAVLELARAEPGTRTRDMPSRRTVREVAIADFFQGPGVTILAPGEILTHIRFGPLPDTERPRGLKSAARAHVFAAWDKFGTRPAMEIAVASVGVAIKIEEGIVTHARVAYGSVAPTPLRGRQAETQLVGNALSAETIERCVSAARMEIAPITDVRATAAYRREVVGVMLTRMLEGAGCE